MPIKGISEAEEIIINTILKPYKEKYDFYYYGSRVKGNFRQLSDLDIMIKGQQEVELHDINDLKSKFDQSNLSYIVNMADFYSLDDNFYKLIKNDLIKIIL